MISRHLTSRVQRVFEAVSKQSLSEVVFDQLRNRIVNSELKAGDELPSERVLCELLQVNRGAVREAIKRLQQAGLVQVRHGGATRVLDFRAEAGLELLPSLLVDADGAIRLDVARSIVRMRQVLTPQVAADAARATSPALAETLDAIVKKMDACEDTAQLQHLTFDYWEALVDGSGNIAYRLALNSLRKTYNPIWELLTQVLKPEFHDGAAFHTLTDAIRAGDAEAAFTAARTHIDLSSRLINDFLDAYEAQSRTEETYR